MRKQDLDQLLRQSFMLADGSTGAELSRRGMPAGVSTELWALENPDLYTQMQRDYIQSGAQMVLTCTFGGSPIKLSHYGAADRTEEINRRLVELSRAAAREDAYVGADLGPTGEFMAPLGTMTLEDMIACYKRQVQGLLQGQPDFFVLETFMDVAEARAAVLAIKESCDLPFIVSMTFDPSGRTLTGATPEAVAVTFTALGASAVGCNCSGGPESLKAVVSAMRAATELPLYAKPNAGLPEVQDGKTVFKMQPEEFAAGVCELIGEGASVVGGCCGTNPAHIAALRDALAALTPAPLPHFNGIRVSSQRKAVTLGGDSFTLIGERINPSGKPDLIDELKDGYPDTAMDLARAQQAQGAQILDINAGCPGVDEKETLCMLVDELSQSIAAPFSLDSMDADALCAALRRYPGSALVNSICPGPNAEKLFAAAALYGGTPVLMPMKGGCVPATARERLECVTELLAIGEKYGFHPGNVLVDAVTPPCATGYEALGGALDFISAACSMGFTTIAGVSNVSFGMPHRAQLNRAWMTALISRGLHCVILNPTDAMRSAAAAAMAVSGRDEFCGEYIQHARRTKK
ncbi:MAG: homocysteine S-methyltransferase family protein [Eubacteriales bacterium]|nr:homocysteine S-methyltransferase family protein [Eubacteriales bacterium]